MGSSPSSEPVLSRIAESLYWLGRYVERAEDTARILDVHYHLLLEDLSVDEAVACRALLEVMGAGGSTADPCGSETVTRLLAFDDSYAGSIVGSVTAAWSNARGIREAVSSEMWECLNATYVELPTAAALAAEAPHAFFGWIKSRAAMLSGLAESTLSHDDGWRFFVVGRGLERVDMTARLLSARYGDTWGQSGWITTLRCCSAYEAYLRTYRRAVDGSLAAEFLLLDRLFPRSVFCALSAAESCLAEIDPSARRTGFDDEARRRLGRARTALEFRSAPELLGDLPRHLVTVQAECAGAGAAIADRYFRQTAAIAWSA